MAGLLRRAVRWIGQALGGKIQVEGQRLATGPGLTAPALLATIAGAPASGGPPAPGALSELLVMEYLVQETSRTVEPILWTDSDGDRVSSNVHGVKLELQEFNTRTGHFLTLSLCHGEYTVRITEPAQPLLFARTSEDRRKVAALLVELHKRVTTQIARRRQEASRNQEQIRQMLFRRLIFGDRSKSLGD